VLSIAVNRQLVSLMQETYGLLDRVQGEVADEEISLRVANIRRILDDLQSVTGLGPTDAFNSMARHLHWLQRRHREGQPDLFAPDVADIRERDLPGVVSAVEAWGRQLLDPGLASAIATSWEAQHFGSAVRDAFIYLEDILRDVGEVQSGTGLSGDRLVTRLLSRSSSQGLVLSSDGFMGQLTTGEQEGTYSFVKGAFLLFRNATAHRPIPYSSAEAEDIIHVVNLCLRLLRGATPPHPDSGVQL
jgi:uncharacterized protein (TIGR02391 family)